MHIDQAGNLTSSQPASGSGVRWQFEDKPLQLKSYLRTGSPVILGATAAWSRSLFERFGPIREDLTYEDMALGFRARLSGGISFIGAPLIKYRLHDHNLHHSSNGETMRWSDLIAEDRRRKTGLVRKRGLVRSFYADLEKAGNCGLLEKWECTELMSAVERFEKTHALELDFRNAWLPRRLRLFPRLAALQSERTERFELAYRLLPCWTYYAVRLFKAYVRKLALQR